MKPSLVQRHTRVCLFKILARPTLCYSSEAWTLIKSDEHRITTSEMKFMRRAYKVGQKRNEEVLQALNIIPTIDYILYKYQKDWLSHVNRMPRGRIPRAILNYNPQGKRSLGRPRKRWRENFQ
ncbi:hypothetical protein C0J52_16225 [Blattella germanica]|nr:hypothetical protein C0J52_16225 [Blattella germanica]